jgi:hypothetical protein
MEFISFNGPRFQLNFNWQFFLKLREESMPGVALILQSAENYAENGYLLW